MLWCQALLQLDGLEDRSTSRVGDQQPIQCFKVCVTNCIVFNVLILIYYVLGVILLQYYFCHDNLEKSKFYRYIVLDTLLCILEL